MSANKKTIETSDDEHPQDEDGLVNVRDSSNSVGRPLRLSKLSVQLSSAQQQPGQKI